MKIKKTILIFLVVLALGTQTPTYIKAMNEEILVPIYFPFKVTHTSRQVTGKKIFLHYQNIEIAGSLVIHAEPTAGEIILPIGNMYKPVRLKKGYHGYIGETQKGYELIFLSDNRQYSVKLLGNNKEYKPSEKELVKVVKWMLFSKDTRGNIKSKNPD